MLFRFCNALLGLNYSMIGENSSEIEADKITNTTLNVLNIMIPIICVVMGLVSVAWGLWCVIKFFRADDGEKRDTAKKTLIYSFVALVVVVVLCAILIYVKNMLPSWVGEKPFPNM